MVGGRRPSVEDDLWWKTTYGGRRPSVEDNFCWKTILACCLVRFAAFFTLKRHKRREGHYEYHVSTNKMVWYDSWYFNFAETPQWFQKLTLFCWKGDPEKKCPFVGMSEGRGCKEIVIILFYTHLLIRKHGTTKN